MSFKKIDEVELKNNVGVIIFDGKTSVKNINRSEYAIKTGDELLATSGINNCCGIAVVNQNVPLLLHIAAITSVQEVIDFFDKFPLNEDSLTVITPGNDCRMIDYKTIYRYFCSRKVKTEVFPLRDTGSIIIDDKHILVYSGVDLDREIKIGGTRQR